MNVRTAAQKNLIKKSDIFAVINQILLVGYEATVSQGGKLVFVAGRQPNLVHFLHVNRASLLSLKTILASLPQMDSVWAKIAASSAAMYL